MRASLKYCLFAMLFSSFVFVYLSLPYVTPSIRNVQDGLIFGKGGIGFAFLIVLLMTGAFIATTFVHCACHFIRKIFFKKNRIGEIFVSLGLITPDELAAALSTRKLKIGEILMKKVLQAEPCKERGSASGRNNYLAMSDMLLTMGFSADDEIQWALQQKNTKIGKILKEKTCRGGLIQ